MRSTVLLIAAHPDDEVLGAGGTLARHVDDGDGVHLAFVAEGESSRPEQASGVAPRKDAARAAAATLGCAAPVFFGLADQRLDTLPLLDIIRRIEALVAEIGPSVIYTHHPGDLNADHRLVAHAALTACRPLPGSVVRAIYAFEVPSSTEWSPGGAAAQFSPARFVDISRTMQRKMEALRCYDAEMRPFPHPRSYEAVQALATWRGACAGLAAAEAFVVLREVADAQSLSR